jgi:hypothetical protein
MSRDRRRLSFSQKLADANLGTSPHARRLTAPVSHQKRRNQSATNAIEFKQNDSKINKPDRYSAAHNGLVAGSRPLADKWNLLPHEGRVG